MESSFESRVRARLTRLLIVAYRAFADRSRLLVREARRADEKQGLALAGRQLRERHTKFLEFHPAVLLGRGFQAIDDRRRLRLRGVACGIPLGTSLCLQAHAPVGARFHPALARCQRLDSHCLRAHCTIKRPRVSTNHLVRQTILHREDFPSKENPTLRWLNRVCIKLLTPAIFCDLSFVCLIQTGPTAGPRHHRIRSARNFSSRHCSLRPTPHMTQYWQAAACPRAAQQKRRRTEVSVPHSGSPGTVGTHNNTPKRVCVRMRLP
jgi:hypothetical protein